MENGILDLFNYDEKTNEIEYLADMFRFLKDQNFLHKVAIHPS
jgi:hypothetical protein